MTREKRMANSDLCVYVSSVEECKRIRGVARQVMMVVRANRDGGHFCCRGRWCVVREPKGRRKEAGSQCLILSGARGVLQNRVIDPVLIILSVPR